VYKLSGDSDQRLDSSRNIGAELTAVINGVKYMETNLPKIEYTIYYDYIGIEKWYDGSWKAKTAVTIGYKEFVQKRKL